MGRDNGCWGSCSCCAGCGCSCGCGAALHSAGESALPPLPPAFRLTTSELGALSLGRWLQRGDWAGSCPEAEDPPLDLVRVSALSPSLLLLLLLAVLPAELSAALAPAADGFLLAGAAEGDANITSSTGAGARLRLRLPCD